MELHELKEAVFNPKVDRLLPSLESLIQPQLNDNFVDNLIDTIDARYTLGEHHFVQELEKLFKDRFNIYINFKWDSDYASFTVSSIGNALGDVSKNEYVINAVAAGTGTHPETIRRELEKIKQEDIRIDLQRVKIYGYNSKLNYIFIDENMMKKDYTLTSKEIAAILLHEMGHIFTFIYYSANIFRNSFNLIESLQLYSNGEIKKAESILITNDDKNKKYDVLIRRRLEDLNLYIKEFGNFILGMQGKDTLNRTSENEADEFAVKFGLGGALATALEKVLIKDAYKNTTRLMIRLATIVYVLYVLFFIIQIFLSGMPLFIPIILIISGVMAPVSIGLLSIYIMTVGVFMTIITKLLQYTGIETKSFEYDKITTRIERMKRDIIKMLRTYKLNKEVKDRLIKQIDTIEGSLKVIKDKLLDTNIGAILTLSNMNFGLETDLDAIYDMIVDRLTNNDFHYLAEKAKKS